MSLPAFHVINGIQNSPDNPHEFTDESVRWGRHASPPLFDIFKFEYRERGTIGRLWRQYGFAKSFAAAMAAEDGMPTIVAHSWGNNVALLALAKYYMGPVGHFHMIAAAAEPNFHRNGLNAMLKSGRLGGVTLYRGGRDSALDRWATLSETAAKPLEWLTLGKFTVGYRRAGSMQLKEEDYAIEPSVRPRVRFVDRPTFEHSTWFDGGWADRSGNLHALWCGITGRPV